MIQPGSVMCVKNTSYASVYLFQPRDAGLHTDIKPGMICTVRSYSATQTILSPCCYLFSNLEDRYPADHQLSVKAGENVLVVQTALRKGDLCFNEPPTLMALQVLLGSGSIGWLFQDPDPSVGTYWQVGMCLQGFYLDKPKELWET